MRFAVHQHKANGIQRVSDLLAAERLAERWSLLSREIAYIAVDEVTTQRWYAGCRVYTREDSCKCTIGVCADCARNGEWHT